MQDTFAIRRLEALGEREVAQLAEVLVDCVEGGASVGFMQPMTRDKAETFWRRVAATVARGDRCVLVAEEPAARGAGKTLLVLDTATEEAARLYARQGWVPCGEIPDYALLPDGPPCATRLFYKRLASAPQRGSWLPRS